MTVREINQITRDGGNGRNVYATLDGEKVRIVRARMSRGVFQVRTITGWWVDAQPSDCEVSL